MHGHYRVVSIFSEAISENLEMDDAPAFPAFFEKSSYLKRLLSHMEALV